MRTKLHLAIILNLSLVCLILPQVVCLGADYYDSIDGDNSIYSKFPSNWEHLPGPLKTKDEGNVPPELEPYDPDPENFHPTGNQSDPCVIRDQGKFRMWFCAFVVNDGVEMQGQAYAESLQDGILWEDPKDKELWVKLVVKPDSGTAFETPDVCKNPNTGEYFLYSSVHPLGSLRYYISLATSQDGGVTWTKRSAPVLTPKYDWEQPVNNSGGVLEPSVIYDENEQCFKMWYSAEGIMDNVWAYRIGYATSKDGINWERLPKPVFVPEAGKWDSQIVSHEDVVKDPAGGYHLFYVGTYSINSAGLYGIGHAYSEDGIHWERNPENPIIKREPNTWKSGMVGGPTPVFHNGKLYLYYFGSKNNQSWTQVYFGLSIGQFETVPIYTITATAGTGGTITPSGEVKVEQGKNQTFTITPNSGYHIADVLVDAKSVGAVTTYTFTNVTSNHTIHANFAQDTPQPTYTITATAGTGGTITPSGEVKVEQGKNQTFTITPNSGYHIADVLVDAKSVGAVTTYTFTNVTSNHTIHANFAQDTPQPSYTITATAGTGGTITPSGEVKVEQGKNQTFTITPNSGYHIADVLVDAKSVGVVTTYTFTNVTSNHTIHASFSGSSSKFPSNWEHLPGPLKTKDEGNVPPELEPYDPDPENFHPTGNQSDPCVLWDQGKFRMWFNAYVVNDGVGMQGQAYAESLQDGILWEDPKDKELWVKLVVPPDTGTAYETPNVCIYPITGEYYMYSSVRGGSGPSGWYIKMAKSRDGINWTKHPDPVLIRSYSWEEAGVLEPSVIYDEDEQIFKMWYASWGTYNGRWQGFVCYATSPNGINWQKRPEPIFLPEVGSWDAELVGHENVIKDPNGGYHLVYVGTYSLGQAGLYGIGHAYSEDGIHWERNPDNPIVKREPNTWRSGMVGGPTPVFYNGKLYLYYFGSQNNQVWTKVYFGLSIGTFNNVNRPPVLNAIGNKSVNEVQTLSFTVSGSDPDGDVLVYSASNLPTGASFNVGTRTFSWTPTYDQAGIYNNVHFEVSDGIAIDSENITITVNNVNRSPILNAIGNKSVNEGQTLSFTVSGSDPDGDSLTYSASNLPQGASFNAGTRTFSWTPTYQQAGTYPNVHFAVTDGSLSDSEDITITVNNVTGPPVLDPIGNKSVDENSLLTFTVNATDPDGDALTYSASNLPLGAGFNTATRTFSWTPTYEQAGIYNNVHFEVSDGTAKDSEDITITVNNVNRAPVLDPIGNKSVNEGQTLSFTVSGSDPDGDNLTYSASNLPQGASFNAGTRTFSWAPAYNQAGTYPNVHFAVTDGSLSDTEDITITVNNVNRPPTADNQALSLQEDTPINISLIGSDPDGDNLTYTIVAQVAHGTLSGTAPNITYKPNPNYNGTDSFTFKVNDGKLDSNIATVSLTINPVNDPPVLASIGNKSIDEGRLLEFQVSATDPDGDILTYSASNLPQGASFNAGSRTFSWTPAYNQAGTYPNVHFEVTDGSLSDLEDITITVNNVNRPPTADNQALSLQEDTPINISLTGSDPDGDNLTYTIVAQVAHGTLSGTAPNITYKPNLNYNGTDSFTFKVNDGKLDSNIATVSLTINPANDPPILASIGNKSIDEGRLLEFQVSATDPDGDILTYSASNLPQGASFNAGSRTFSWTPAYNQAGTYPNVHFAVTDGSLSDAEDITITVNNVNRAPVLDSIGNKSITENQTLTFTVNATDLDGDPLTYSVQDIPNRAIFQNQTFTWTPITSDVGEHQITFTASDGYLSDSETITITVLGEDEDIEVNIRFNTDRIRKTGTLYISGETNEGAVIEEVKVLDEYNKILDIDMKDNVGIIGEGYITGIVIVKDIIKKYPLVSGIKVRIKVRKGERTGEGETGLARIEPYRRGPDRIGVYNNVFNPLKGEKTLIKVDATEQTHIKINLYDTKGKKIKEITDEEGDAGICRYYWDGKDESGNVVGSGLYLIHIEAGDYKETKKIVVVK